MPSDKQRSSPERRLAAILFADIVGYTALMQADESNTMSRLNHYQTVLKEAVSKHNGEIIKNYGDGSLCIFSSVLDAVRCAKAVQETLRQTPKVPLRIGLHLGDVMYRENDIYGDAINVASRIESLGVTGSVLMSKDTYKKVANQTELQFQSLGNVEFKNVKEPVEVFALANEGFPIPKAEEMQSKVKPVPSKRHLILWGIMAIFFFLGGLLGWQQFFNSDKDLLPESIREARIAVLPFENRSNDPELDFLGDMAADWIIQGMMNLDELNVVSYETVKDHLPFLLAEMGTKQSFHERTGAEKIIKGSIYPDGDVLIFQTQIVDARKGGIKFVFPEITGDKTNITATVKDLRERVLSYFAIKAEKNSFVEILAENPPKYEAFKAQIKAVSYIGIDPVKRLNLHYKAISIDSSFFYPYRGLFFYYLRQGQRLKADSILQVIERRFPILKPYEQLYYDLLKTYLSSNLQAQYQQVKKLFEKDPKNFDFNRRMGEAAEQLNRPQESIAYYQYLNPQAVPVDIKFHSWWHHNYAAVLIKLNRLDEAMEILRLVPTENATNGIFYRKLDIYVLKNQRDSIHNMIEELEYKNFPNDLIHGLLVRSVKKCATIKDEENQMYWTDLAIKKISNHPESVPLDKANLATAYYYGEQYNKALTLYQELLNAESPTIFRLMRLGSCYAKLGRNNNAMEIINQLENMKNPYAVGQNKYAIAQIYSMLGQKEQALDYMKQAFRGGVGFAPHRYQFEFEFISLRGYPPFEEFVKPKG